MSENKFLFFTMKVERVLNSNESIRLDEKFKVLVQICYVPSGGCSHAQQIPEILRKKLKNMRNVLNVAESNDQMCLARCFILGRVFNEHGTTSPEFKSVRDYPKRQREEAMKLLEQLKLPQTELSIEHLPKFSEVILPTIFLK